MLDGFMQWLGFGLCHQLPERSFIAGGLQLPVCARDTGIYIGFAVSLAVVALLHGRSRPTGFPHPRTWLVMAVFVGLMAWDGITSYAGLRETTNDLRLFTGLAAGFAMAVVVAPILNDELWRTASRERVLEPIWRLAVWVAVLPVSYLIIRSGGPLLGIGYASITAAAIIFTLSCVNLIVVAMLPTFDRRAESLFDLVPAIVIAVIIAVVEIWLAGILRQLLLGVIA